MYVLNTMTVALQTFSKLTIVHGDCVYGGVDTWADEWGREQAGFVDVEAYPARDFPSPPARNTHMVKLGAMLCLAFPAKGSRGTWDCLRKAVDAGIESAMFPLPSKGPS